LRSEPKKPRTKQCEIWREKEEKGFWRERLLRLTKTKTRRDQYLGHLELDCSSPLDVFTDTLKLGLLLMGVWVQQLQSTLQLSLST
ncbi:hypothetical protein MKW98_001910, partial [Papaver atlanticum]